MNEAVESMIERVIDSARREPGIGAQEDAAVTRQILRDCIGDRPVSPRFIFWECDKCRRIRCTRELSRFPLCLCGSRRVGVYGGEMDTKKAAAALAECLTREKAEARTNWMP